MQRMSTFRKYLAVFAECFIRIINIVKHGCSHHPSNVLGGSTSRLLWLSLSL